MVKLTQASHPSIYPIYLSIYVLTSLSKAPRKVRGKEEGDVITD
jgi:hypothetical protein